MFSKTKSWLPGAIWKPKNPHSLEHLKYLHNVLCKNQTVTEQNRSLLVETLRSISEILIWGDQNDSSVFDFFLEKNMLSFFLRYLRQKYGRFICVQLLQTLNILFENISNETSLYYLLSNNHINSIIVHKFDFSDEEVMAYYISFLKTLSLKLNRHTIHFFYNEHTNDFALYTEAIKFFNHSEAMVRIAVRTITLNVFRVDDKAMLRYIRDRTAAPYFSNLVWFIGNHILDLDLCVRHDSDHRSRGRLADLVAEHLDHLHYLNDILCINIDALNQVLTDQMLNRLLIPLYVYSLTFRKRQSDVPDERKHVSSVVSLFLLSQVFLIIQYAPLVQQLAEVIFQGDISLSNFAQDAHRDSPKMQIREFRPPAESLEKTLENHRPKRRGGAGTGEDGEEEVIRQEGNSTFYPSPESGAEAISSPSTEGALSPSSEAPSVDTELSSPNQNSTDEEKLTSLALCQRPDRQQTVFTLENRPYLEAVFNALECSENDYAALFALCLLYAIGHNEGISQGLLDLALMPTDRSETKQNYNVALVEKLIRIITQACQQGSRVRLATLQLSIKLLKQLVYTEGRSFLQDRHLAGIENSRELSTQVLRNFYKSEEIFLDMFEDEYREIKNRPLNVEYLMMDASILLPPTGTPLTGIDFNKRLPCGEVERARRAIHVFFLIRDLSLTLLGELEEQLPLTKEETCVKINDVLDLNNSDLIACTVVTRESRKQERRFLVIDPLQLILVEPDVKRLGWGVVRFVGFLQDVEVSGDKDDSRLLHITVHKPSSSMHTRAMPLLSARFFFDDHIRCMAAKQRLIKGRLKARQQKMATIEALLDIQNQADAAGNFRSGPIPGRSHPVSGGADGDQRKSPSPGPQSGARSKQQRVAAEQKKLLLAKAQRSRGRQDNQNNSRATSAPVVSPRDEVEVAEEATSAFAFQALNQGSHRQPATPPRSKSSGASSLGDPHEIPMEDLSQKGKGRTGSLERGKPGRPQNRDVQQKQGRSHSCSPRRGSGSRLECSSFSTTAAATKRVRRLSAPQTTSSVASHHHHHPHLHHGVLRHHSKSNPLPLPRTRCSSDSSADGYLHSGTTAGGISPSLRPAEAPPLSLVSTSESAGIPRDSPKLVPPSEAMKSAGTEAGTQGEGKEGGEGGKEETAPPREGPSPSDSPAKQLTQLAQMVQQHYHFPGSEAKATAMPEQVEGSK